MKDRAKNGASERAGREWGRKARKGFLSLPLSLFHFLALVPFLAWPNLKFLQHISMKPLKVNNILFYLDQDIEITTF